MVQLGHGATVRAGGIDPALAAWGLSMQRDTDTFAHDAALIARIVGPVRGADPSLVLDADLLARVTLPTLLLWGADDTFGGPDVAERLRAALPAADLVVLPDSGHLPWFDDAGRWRGSRPGTWRGWRRRPEPGGRVAIPLSAGGPRGDDSWTASRSTPRARRSDRRAGRRHRHDGHPVGDARDDRAAGTTERPRRRASGSTCGSRGSASSPTSSSAASWSRSSTSPSSSR